MDYFAIAVEEITNGKPKGERGKAKSRRVKAESKKVATSGESRLNKLSLEAFDPELTGEICEIASRIYKRFFSSVILPPFLNEISIKSLLVETT